jgi:hypothetical protein
VESLASLRSLQVPYTATSTIDLLGTIGGRCFLSPPKKSGRRRRVAFQDTGNAVSLQKVQNTP